MRVKIRSRPLRRNTTPRPPIYSQYDMFGFVLASVRLWRAPRGDYFEGTAVPLSWSTYLSEKAG